MRSPEPSRWFGVDPKSGRELMAPFLGDLVPVSTEGQGVQRYHGLLGTDPGLVIS